METRGWLVSPHPQPPNPKSEGTRRSGGWWVPEEAARAIHGVRPEDIAAFQVGAWLEIQGLGTGGWGLGFGDWGLRFETQGLGFIFVC